MTVEPFTFYGVIRKMISGERVLFSECALTPTGALEAAKRFNKMDHRLRNNCPIVGIGTFTATETEREEDLE